MKAVNPSASAINFEMWIGSVQSTNTWYFTVFNTLYKTEFNATEATSNLTLLP
jgi:hypothetical protein